MKNQKKKKIRESKIFLHKYPPKRWFENGIHSLLRQSDVRRSADIIYCMWHISLLCRSDTVLDVTK